MTTKKSDLVKLFFSMLNAEGNADFETVLMGIDGIMTGHWVTWANYTDMVVNADAVYGLEEKTNDIAKKYAGGKELFADDCNNLYVAHNFDAFNRLCQVCMTFAHMEYKVKYNQQETNHPY